MLQYTAPDTVMIILIYSLSLTLTLPLRHTRVRLYNKINDQHFDSHLIFCLCYECHLSPSRCTLDSFGIVLATSISQYLSSFGVFSVALGSLKKNI